MVEILFESLTVEEGVLVLAGILGLRGGEVGKSAPHSCTDLLGVPHAALHHHRYRDTPPPRVSATVLPSLSACVTAITAPPTLCVTLHCTTTVKLLLLLSLLPRPYVLFFTALSPLSYSYHCSLILCATFHCTAIIKLVLLLSLLSYLHPALSLPLHCTTAKPMLLLSLLSLLHPTLSVTLHCTATTIMLLFL